MLVGDGQNNGIAGGNGADGVFGRDGNDTLAGDAGADTLFGGTGNDVLVGGTEADVFVFDTAASASNIDTILDFSVVDDTIAIENAVFSGLAAGPLAASAFVSGTQATLASHRIVYNGATGQLFFDADGSGAGAAIQIATLVAAPRPDRRRFPGDLTKGRVVPAGALRGRNGLVSRIPSNLHGNCMTAPQPRLDLKRLTRAFGGRPVVSDVSLTVAAGQVTCLLGPSGCGKSTTLRIIAGVERADTGEVWIDGVQMAGPALHLPPERRGIGMMFQDFALFPHLTVEANVAFGLSGDRAAKARRVGELLERVNLSGFAANTPHQLSGGEQQRVALARALAPRPRVMLMDEPFSGLDNRLRDGIRDTTLDILKEEGAAVVLVTHEPDEAMRMADEIALMRGGRIVQKGAPYNVYNKPVDKAAAAFFSDINVIRGVSRGALTENPVRRLPDAGPCRWRRGGNRDPPPAPEDRL